MNQSLRAKQINYCYPYGLTFADAGKGVGVQPCKHGGKELDAMYGLCRSDFGARHLSPYLYCANNPFNLIDPDGWTWIAAKYGDDSFYFWDESVTTQHDIAKHCDKTTQISYVGEKSTITCGDDMTLELMPDGSFTINSKEVSGEYNKDGLHVGSTKLTKLDRINANYYGSYLGSTNPELIEDDSKYSYAVPPINDLDYAAFNHDTSYDEHKAVGIDGALWDLSVSDVDYELAKSAFQDYKANFSLSQRTLWGGLTWVGFSIIGTYKNSFKNKLKR